MEDHAIDDGPQPWERGLQRGSFHRSKLGERWSIMDFPLARTESLARLQRRNQHRTPELTSSFAFFERKWIRALWQLLRIFHSTNFQLTPCGCFLWMRSKRPRAAIRAHHWAA